MPQNRKKTDMATNGKAPQITTDFDTIDLDKKDENGTTHLAKNGQYNGQFAVQLAAINEQYDGNCLGVPRTGHRPSIMELECAKERTRVALLKQCSAILKQGDQRYTKESLHRTFQDEVSSNFFFIVMPLYVNQCNSLITIYVNHLQYAITLLQLPYYEKTQKSQTSQV